MLLTDYLVNARDLLHDPNGNFYSTTSLTRWVNRARLQVAKDGECVRILTPSTASLASVTVTSAGSGYTAGAATVSLPDASGPNLTTATVAPVFSGGQLASVGINNPGAGYVAAPTITVTGNGSGAAAMAVLSPHVATVQGQEVYAFAAAAAVLQALYPGARSVIGLQSVSVSWGGMKPTLDHISFSEMQGYLRSWQVGMAGPPCKWAQYAQGAAGSIYLWPVPSQVTSMEWDCYCSVMDLVGTSVPDLIPEPWDEAVAYYAAKLAFENAQRFDDSRTMFTEYGRLMMNARAATTPPVIPSFYGAG